jgi:hypothetical protein
MPHPENSNLFSCFQVRRAASQIRHGEPRKIFFLPEVFTDSYAAP